MRKECKTCGGKLRHPLIGRKRQFCSKACARKDGRKRLKESALLEEETARTRDPVDEPRRPRILPRRQPSLAVVPEKPLTEAEKEQLLGRPLAHGLTFDDYRILTGRGFRSELWGRSRRGSAVNAVRIIEERRPARVVRDCR
jgi:endogenous inhibitor of DNA gyrase (YacG/DUF329 family)